MSQPIWKLVANLGDVSCPDYTGYFVFTDETGVYDPELVKIDPNDYDGSWDADEPSCDCADEGDSIVCDECADYVGKTLEMRRMVLEPCTFENGILSDNPYHPDHAVWFADSIDSICRSMDYDRDDLIAHLCGDDPRERAFAYMAIADYHGWDNFDSYPDTIGYAEAEECIEKWEATV